MQLFQTVHSWKPMRNSEKHDVGARIMEEKNKNFHYNWVNAVLSAVMNRD